MQFLLEKNDTVIAKSVRFSTLVYVILSFSVVIITFGDSWMPLGIISAGFLLTTMIQPSLVIVIGPFLVLFFSVLLSSTLWRSALFIVGLLMLTAEWLFMLFMSNHIWFSIMTSLPYIAVVAYWTAVSLNAILRRKKPTAVAPGLVAESATFAPGSGLKIYAETKTNRT